MNRPISEHDDFLLSRLVDDDLSAEEAAALHARIEREPDLRTAYQAMTRLDSLLTARRADQPAIDWERFHRRVMEKIETEALIAAARPATFRIADYLRFALPLAAAAAIALMVWAWPRGGPIAANTGKANRPGSGLVQATHPKPAPAQEGFIAVIYDDPKQHTVMGETETQVSYAQSEELQNEFRQKDEAARNKESSHWYMAGNPRKARESSQELLIIEASSSL